MISAFLLAGSIMFGANDTTIKDSLPKKDVFVYYHTSWCGWCRYTDKNILSDSSLVSDLNKKYTFLKVDCGSDKQIPPLGKTEHQLCLEKKIHCYPNFVVYSSNMKKVKKKVEGALTDKSSFRYVFTK